MNSPLSNRRDSALGSPSLSSGPMSPMLHAVEPAQLTLDTDEDAEDQPEALHLPDSALRAEAVDWPAGNGQSAYAAKLYNSMDRVIEQAEAGRSHSKALLTFIRSKAELDRQYAHKLRALSEAFSTSLELPARPRTTVSFQAGCVAIRNLVSNLATNSITLADQVDEAVADVFSDEAKELTDEVKSLVSETKAASKKHAQAMAHLDQCKRNLMKTCQEMEFSGADSTRKSSNAGPLDLLTSALRPSADVLAKKLATQDATYIAAIKSVRGMRAEYDASVAEQLAQFELLELQRMNASRACMISFARIHEACYTSHLKGFAVVHKTLATKIAPANDIQTFVQETLQASRQSTQPPPLPVYRLFKGHPRFEAEARVAKKKRRGADPPTDSDESDSGEEITLSSDEEEEEDEDGEEDDEQEAGSDADEDEARASATLASALAKSKATAELSTKQLAALQSLLERVVALPPLDYSKPASPVVLEPERSVVLAALRTPAGRSALAATLKRIVAAASKPPPPVAEPEDAQAAESAMTSVDLGPPQPQPLLVSAAAIEELFVLLTALLDAAAPVMHVQPVSSILRSARLMVCSESALAISPAAPATPTKAAPTSAAEATPKTAKSSGKKGKKGKAASAATELVDEEASLAAAATASSPASSSDPSLFARLCEHPLFGSARFYEAAFLASLDRGWRRHAAVHRWQSDAEQASAAQQQQQLACELLLAAAKSMLDIGRSTDEQVVAFISKMVAINQLPEAAQASLVDALPCFARQGLTEVPALSGLAPLVADLASTASTSTTTTTTTEEEKDDAALSVAPDDAGEDDLPLSPVSQASLNAGLTSLPMALPVKRH